MKNLQIKLNTKASVFLLMFCFANFLGCDGKRKEAPRGVEGEYLRPHDMDGRYEPSSTPYISRETYLCTSKQTDLIYSTVKVIDRHRVAQLHDLARKDQSLRSQIAYNRGFEINRYLDFETFGLSPSISEAAQAQRWALEFTDACEQVLPCTPRNEGDQKLQEKMYDYCSAATYFAFVSHHRWSYSGGSINTEYTPVKNFENQNPKDPWEYDLYYRFFELGMPLYLKEYDEKTTRNLNYLCHIRDDLFDRLDPEQKFYKRQSEEVSSCEIIRKDFQELISKRKQVTEPIAANGVCDDQFSFYYHLVETAYENYKREESHFGKGKTLDTLYYGQGLDVLRETCDSVRENFPTMECQESNQSTVKALKSKDLQSMCEVGKDQKRKYIEDL